MAYFSRKSSTLSGPLEYAPTQQYASATGVPGFEVIPEEVGLVHAPSGVQLGGSQRLADGAFASWRSGTAPSTSLTSTLNLSTRSSDVDLKEFLVQRGRHPLLSLHKAAAQGDRVGIMHIMKQLGPNAPLDELDANGCTPLMYAVMAESRLAIEMLLNFSARREQTDSEGRTAVHYAAFFGKHKSLKFLIDTASDWLSRDVYGRTPLHWACCSKSTRCLAVLLKHAQTVLGDINPVDGEGMTPLHCAAQYGRPTHIILLSEAGCDFTSVDIEEKTALHWTAGNRDSACVEALLDTYPPLLNRQDNNGSTLLHLTATSGSTHLVDTLLRMAGIDIDMKDSAERTPLHYSSLGGHAEIVQLLLTFGALDSCIDSQGFTALHYAVQSSSTASVTAFTHVTGMSHLPDANEGKTPLMIAAQNAAESIVKTLLDNRAVVKTINHTDTEGRTALHLACECGSEECVTLLLSYGANPNLQDNMTQTALMTACIAGHTSCIHPLIAGGANAQMVDGEDHTPLLKAVLYNQPQAVQSLVLAGVDLNTQDLSGCTAVHMAAYGGDGIILSMLLENGANPNIQDANGLSPLHMAAVEGHTYCVTLLASHKAYINLSDFSDERLTPLDYAVQNGHSECAEELKRNGAVSVATIRGMAAICIQTIYRGFRARRLRATLKRQTQAVTLLAAHMRTFLQKKRYAEIKERHYAAIKIQAAFRGYCQRVLFLVKKAEVLEREKKQKMVEDFAQLVMRQKELLQPFPSKTPERELPTADQLATEQQSRLEAAMKMREMYEEKQRRWQAFREAERQRRIDKAEREELNRLASVIAQSRARREYTQSMYKQTLSVRSHHHAAIIIQRAFHRMRLKRSWQERVQARLELEKKKRENRAAVCIQRAWKRYQQYKIYKATHFKSVLTSPVVALSDPLLAKTSCFENGEPSYNRSISITGNPRRKVNETIKGGFRVPKLIAKSPRLPTIPAHTLRPFFYPLHTQQNPVTGARMLFPSRRELHQRSVTAPVFKFSVKKRSKRSSEGALPEIVSPAKTSSTTVTAEGPMKINSFHLPQIIHN